MKFFATGLTAIVAALSFSGVQAEQIIMSNSLNSCKGSSNFTATLFNVAFTPANRSVSIAIDGLSSLEGNVTVTVQLLAYGFSIQDQTIDPCTMGFAGFCPLKTGELNILTNIAVPESVVNQIPGAAYIVPDLDGVVRIKVNSRETGETIACLEADLSNQKSVYVKAVGWVTAIIAGMGLLVSGIVSCLGHTNTAAHVAANAVSLFGFFQAQAVIGMSSVNMPPIVQSWTQNFQWSMGIIRVGFLQSIATWYQRATGGTPTTYLSTLNTYSVQVQKRGVLRRSVQSLVAEAGRASHMLSRRFNGSTVNAQGESIIVRGIDRVGFRAGIEQTNIFMTGLIFFVGIVFFVTILVTIAKFALEGLAKAGSIKSDRFVDFRNGWKIVVKGIIFRLVLLGWVQMSILCLWQLIERDSAAEVVLALFVFFSMAGVLGWASYKVITIAKQSVATHKHPAFTLYSDPQCLNKWGFLYIQYRGTAYYFIVPLLVYILLKAIFIGLAQKSPIAQAVGLLIIEAVALIGVCIIKPWMDKKTNIFNISICVINLLNAIFLLVFSSVFGQPEMVSSIMGVIFAFYNIVACLVLLIVVLVASIYAIVSKNPETRYQPMRDDRGSFIKSQQGLSAELDELGATARGDGKPPYLQKKSLDDSDSISNESLPRAATTHDVTGRQPSPPNSASISQNFPTQQAPPQSVGGYGYAEQDRRRAPSPYDQNSQQQLYNSQFSRPGTAPQQRSHNSGDYPRSASSHGTYPPATMNHRQEGPRPQQGRQQWQVGAGYN